MTATSSVVGATTYGKAQTLPREASGSGSADAVGSGAEPIFDITLSAGAATASN